MPVFRTLLLTSALLNTVLSSPLISSVDTFNLFKRAGSGCSTSGPASCQNTTAQSDSCCFEAPGVSATIQKESHAAYLFICIVGSIITDTGRNHFDMLHYKFYSNINSSGIPTRAPGPQTAGLYMVGILVLHFRAYSLSRMKF